MIGSTDRCALKVQNPAYGLCSQGVNGVNSDVVMILHLNPVNHSVSILSIPRDLFVPNARSDGANKIDAALYQGPDQLIAAIEEDFGIPIQHFVELNFDSFINVVQALGGIKMYFPEPVYDAYSGLNIQTTGCLQLNGTQALQVVRARHVQYKGPGVTTDRPHLLAAGSAERHCAHPSGPRVPARPGDRGQGEGSQQPDHGPAAGLRRGWAAHRRLGVLGFRHDQPCPRLPRRRRQQRAAAHHAGGGGPVRQLRVPGRQLRGHRVPGRAAGPQRGRPVPRPQVEQRGHVFRWRAPIALHGDGVGAQRLRRLQPGDHDRQSLQALGFHIGTIGDSPPVGQEAETVVYYASKTPAQLAAAQAVANSLSGAVIMAMDPTQVKPGSQVTVVTGTDFTVNAPPATTIADERRPARRHPAARRPRGQQRQHRELRGLPGTDADRRTAPALGPPLVHRQRRRGHPEPARHRLDAARRQAKISPPLVSSAWPVMADERSEAR